MAGGLPTYATFSACLLTASAMSYCMKGNIACRTAVQSTFSDIAGYAIAEYQ